MCDLCPGSVSDVKGNSAHTLIMEQSMPIYGHVIVIKQLNMTLFGRPCTWFIRVQLMVTVIVPFLLSPATCR